MWARGTCFIRLTLLLSLHTCTPIRPNAYPLAQRSKLTLQAHIALDIHTSGHVIVTCLLMMTASEKARNAERLLYTRGCRGLNEASNCKFEKGFGALCHGMLWCHGECWYQELAMQGQDVPVWHLWLPCTSHPQYSVQRSLSCTCRSPPPKTPLPPASICVFKVVGTHGNFAC